jgi:hypothetical protein
MCVALGAICLSNSNHLPANLFDHLVGAREQRLRHRDPK